MEFFIRAVSFPAPFCGDESLKYVSAYDPVDAMKSFVANYEHPSGLWKAEAYTSADAFHKNKAPVASWKSQDAIKREMENRR